MNHSSTKIRLLAFLFGLMFGLLTVQDLSAGISLEQNEPILLSGKIQYLEDAERLLSVENILDDNVQKQFLHLPVDRNSFGVTNSHWWFKIPIGYTESLSEERLLLLDTPVIFEAHLFQQNNNQLMEIAKGGFAFSAAQRPIKDVRLIFSLPNQNAETTYYLKIYNDGTLQLPLVIYKPEKLMETRSQLNSFLGLYFGLLFSMAIYNLFIGWSTRDNAYFYYVGYIISLILLMSFNEGYAQLLLFPDSPHIAYTGINLGAALTIIFASQFARTFLSTKETAAKLDVWLKINLSLAVLYLFADAYIQGIHKANIIIFLSLSFLLSMLVTGIYSWCKNTPFAKYFVLAWLAMLFGSALMVLAKLGIIPTTFITEFGTHIGSSVEAMLLSLALAAKIKNLVQKRIQAEEKSRIILEQSNLKLQESHKIKDEFFSALSHELRTPIHGVKGAIDLFSSCQLPDDQQENVEILNDSVNEILTYFDHLLILSELKSDVLEIKEDSFSFKVLIHQVTSHFTNLAKERDIRFLSTLPSDLDLFFISDMRILSVCLYQLLNREFERDDILEVIFDVQFIVDNISKNLAPISDKKTIQFQVCSTTNNLENSNDSMIVSSSNSSYDPVTSRIETQFKQHKKGILDIVQSMQDELFETLGARVTATNKNDNQLVQQFELSLKQDNNPLIPEIKNNQGFYTGLVVDDNKANRIIAEKHLRSIGFKTKTASDGQAAIDIFNSNKIDFILMDCHMPRMNGYQATKTIRQNPKASDTPIIAVTADVTKECHLACKQSGMNQVLHKPLSIQTLKQTLAKFGLIVSK